MICALLVGALVCYVLMRQRHPKTDPTCGGRIVPNGSQMDSATTTAAREMWRQHWQEHYRIMQESRERGWDALNAQFRREKAKEQKIMARMLQDIGEYRGQ